MSFPASSRALTADDVAIGQTWYIEHIDLDASVIRFHGPFSALEAQTKTEHFNKIPGHKAKAFNTPQKFLREVQS